MRCIPRGMGRSVDRGVDRPANVNSTLHDDITRYEARFDAAGFAVDRDTLNRTWRCSASVCEFITGQLNIRIAAHGIHASLIETIADTERSATLHAEALLQS